MTVLANTTALDIIKQALKASGALGVGQTPLAEDLNDAFVQLNWMIAQWQEKRWLVYVLETKGVVATGQTSYTAGPGGDFDFPSAPSRIESAFFRQTVQSEPNQIDYPLKIIPSRENYNTIALKQLQSFPSYIFYESDFPLGKVYPWPVPQSSIYEVFISVKTQLSAFATPQTLVNLPAAYYAALFFNLAIRLGVIYKLPDDPKLVGLAKDALNVVRGANTQIANLAVPTELIRPGIYNVFSDQIR